MIMQLKRKCAGCKKPLGEFEGHPNPLFIAPTQSFPLPSGGVEMYCDTCYKNMNSIL